MNTDPEACTSAMAVVSGAVASGRTAGAQLYLSIGGETIVDTAVGNARPGVPMTTSTMVRWGCAATPTMGFTFSKLVDDGVLSLDDPVADTLPAFAQNGKGGYTIADLLSHNVPYNEPALDYRLADMLFEVLSSPTATLDPDRVLATVCAAELIPEEYRLANGGGYSLTSNFFVLSEIIRRAVGINPEDYLRSDIYQPIGMADTLPALSPELRDSYGKDSFGITYITRPNRRRRRLHPFTASESFSVAGLCAPGSSVWGPGRDLGRFYEEVLAALAGSSPALSAASAQRMVTPDRPPGWEWIYGAFQSWGLGVGTMLWPLLGRSVSFDAIGHDGFGATVGLGDPSLGLVVVLATNTVMDQSFALWRSLTDAVYASLGVDASPFERAARSGRAVPSWARPDGAVVGLCPCGECAVTAELMIPALPCDRGRGGPGMAS
jgi:CubicO group peptidase (beta-lactamase class C family)